MNYAALGHLMGAYFHQDWPLLDSDEWAVVNHYLADEPDRARELAADIDRALTEFTTEDELRRLVIDKLGGSFLADWDGGTYRAWLSEVARRARTAAASRPEVRR